MCVNEGGYVFVCRCVFCMNARRFVRMYVDVFCCHMQVRFFFYAGWLFSYT